MQTSGSSDQQQQQQQQSPSPPPPPQQQQQQKNLNHTRYAPEVPQSVIAIDHILQSMGVKEYEPRVIEQLLEFVNRYVTDVLVDSQVYMRHADRTELELDDVRLAIQSRISFSFSEPPPIEFLLETANAKNKQGFVLPENPKVMLPPEQFCLTNRNYQLSASNVRDDIVDNQQPQQKRQRHNRPRF